jgi:hypothetical protein
MNKCIKCEKVKSLDAFPETGKTSNVCKPCKNKANNELRAYRTKLIGRWKVRKGCSNPDCKGHPDHRAALHLAHIEPKLSHFKHSGAYKPWWSWKKIKEELGKCRILCANCHSVETYDEKHYLLWKTKK